MKTGDGNHVYPQLKYWSGINVCTSIKSLKSITVIPQNKIYTW